MGNPDTTSDTRKPATHVDVLLCVDAQSLLATYPNPSQDGKTPTVMENAFFYALSPGQDGLSGQLGEGIDIRAKPGEILRIRVVSPALHAEQSAVIYRFGLENTHCLVEPALALRTSLVLISPDATRPEQLCTMPGNDYFWHTKVISAGEAFGVLDLMLVDPNCTVLGYFRWNATIRIALT